MQVEMPIAPRNSLSEEMAGANRLGFSVIVPCFNEESALPDAILGLREALATEDNYELIVVDDGSTDATPLKLRQLQELI